MTAAALAVVVAVWPRSATFRGLAVLAGLVFAASLSMPLTEADAWQVLARPGNGQRYFLLPMLALAAAAVTLACDPRRVARLLGLALVGCVLAGAWLELGATTWPATDFDRRARAFAHAACGAEAAFPVRPLGTAPMVLYRVCR